MKPGVLVTGGQGFLGEALVSRFLAKGECQDFCV